MSDFGELCPLFNTGVFNEVCFLEIKASNVTGSANLLYYTAAGDITGPGVFTFGRTVVVTKAFIRRRESNEVEQTLNLLHYTSGLATPTVIGTVSITPTTSILPVENYFEFPNVTSATFTSTDVLGLCVVTKNANSAGIYDLIVRYKEK